MIPRHHGSSHSMAIALLLSTTRSHQRDRVLVPTVRGPAPVTSTPSSAWVLLYLPLAWLVQLVVSDLLHLFLHGCTSLSTSARGWGYGVPGGVLGAIGYIHTVHHKHVDAFGTVDGQYKWASLLLDKLVKRSLIQYLSWRLWCGILRLRHLVEDFLRLSRSSAPRAQFAMVLLIRVEALRSALLVVQTVVHHFGARSHGAAANGSRRSGDFGCPIARLGDHPPLGSLPRDCARRLGVAIGTSDPHTLLKWCILTSPVAHSLHHYYVWNFPFQVIDWRALILLLRGARLEWVEMMQAANHAWDGIIELPANSRRADQFDGLEIRHVHAVS